MMSTWNPSCRGKLVAFCQAVPQPKDNNTGIAQSHVGSCIVLRQIDACIIYRF